MHSPCGSRSGLCHVDPTRPRHHDSAEFLWHLVLDLDFLRIGKPPGEPVTRDRLARWGDVSRELRTCFEARFLPGRHDEELAYGDALVETVRADLDAGRVPALPEGAVPHYIAARARIERCRDDIIKR